MATSKASKDKSPLHTLLKYHRKYHIGMPTPGCHCKDANANIPNTNTRMSQLIPQRLKRENATHHAMPYQANCQQPNATHIYPSIHQSPPALTSYTRIPVPPPRWTCPGPSLKHSVAYKHKAECTHRLPDSKSPGNNLFYIFTVIIRKHRFSVMSTRSYIL